jgi:hypothetical protein
MQCRRPGSGTEQSVAGHLLAGFLAVALDIDLTEA